jgi:hypothetical protein
LDADKYLIAVPPPPPPPAIAVPPFGPPPPPPPPTTVILTAFNPAGFTQVPGDVNTVIIILPPAVAAVLVHAVPLEVKTLPLVPGATKETLLVPLPSNTLFVVRVLAPVPPWATERGVVRPDIESTFDTFLELSTTVVPPT